MMLDGTVSRAEKRATENCVSATQAACEWLLDLNAGGKTFDAIEARHRESPGIRGPRQRPEGDRCLGRHVERPSHHFVAVLGAEQRFARIVDGRGKIR